MGWALFLLLVVFPVADLALLFVIADWIGWNGVLIEVLAACLVGSAVLRLWGAVRIEDLQERLETGWTPQEIILDRVLFISAAVLLIVPGMMGDALGLLLLLPPLRRTMGGLVGMLFASYLERHIAFYSENGDAVDMRDENDETIDSFVVKRHETEEERPRIEP